MQYLALCHSLLLLLIHILIGCILMGLVANLPIALAPGKDNSDFVLLPSLLFCWLLNSSLLL